MSMTWDNKRILDGMHGLTERFLLRKLNMLYRILCWWYRRERKATLKDNIVIPPPFFGRDGRLMEWIPWDEV